MSDAIPDRKRIVIDSIPVDPFTIDSLHACIDRVIASADKAVIANVNLHAMAVAHRDSLMKNALMKAEYVFCDGHGIMLLARFQGHRLPEKITYAHWLPVFARHCAEQGHSIFLLGGKPGVAEEAKERLIAASPELKICGTCHGYFDCNPEGVETADVVRQIEQCSPDVLIVCMGMPTQEKWLVACRDRLHFKVALPAGAAFDYVAGRSRRPPAWMTDHGLEWLGRLLAEPARLAGRYLVEMPCYMAGYMIRRWAG